MFQKEKDELIFSLPTHINNILGTYEGLLSVLECIKNIKNQFYDGCATDLLNLIKEHTEKVKASKYPHLLNHKHTFNSSEKMRSSEI